MSLVTVLLSILTAAGLGWLLTGLVHRYAIRRSLLDIPNQRSSHSTPTPRGGGLSIVVVVVIATLGISFVLPGQAVIVLWPGATLLAYALLGWLDDHHDLSARVRFLVQLLLAVVVVTVLTMFAHDVFSPTPSHLLLSAGMVLWIVWMANLYNFMDGIDGLAAIESLVLSVTIAAWFSLLGGVGIAWLMLATAGASIGFLGWNWSPARIFMGDVGSVALGAFFALTALIGWYLYGMQAFAFVILYGVFLVDATVTLLRRIWRREKWWQAHRSHYYQRAVQSGFSHAQVSLAVLVLDVLLALLASGLLAGMLSLSAALAAAVVILFVPMFLIDLRGTRPDNDIHAR